MAGAAATLAERLAGIEERQRSLESDLGLLRNTVHELLLENRRLAMGVAPEALAQSRGPLSSSESHEPPPTSTQTRPDDVLPSRRDSAVARSFAGPRDIAAFLERLRLGRFRDHLRNLGAEIVEDLIDVEVEDLVALGMTKLEQNRFVRAVRAQGVLSERAAIRHGDALEMLLRVDARAGALEEAFQATGWGMQEEWLHGTRALLREWAESGGRLEQVRNQELLAVALTGAEQARATERLLHCMRTSLPSLTVQLTGCGAIQRLGVADARMAIELSTSGACQVILRALRYHDNDVQLSIAGCLALASLAQHGGPEVGRTIGAAGGIAAALACSSQHSENSDLFIAMCHLLQAVPISEFWSRTAQAEAAIAAQRTWLRRTASHEKHAKAHRSQVQQKQKRDDVDDDSNDLPSTLSVVVAGITKYWACALAQTAAVALVERLVEFSEESRPLIAGTGCVKIVIAALKGKRTVAAGAEAATDMSDNLRESVATTESLEQQQRRPAALIGVSGVVEVVRNRDIAARLQAHGCGLLSSLATGNAQLACEIKKAGGDVVARAAIANHDDARVVNAAQHLLGMLDVQRIISTAKKRGDAQGVLIGMRAGIDSNAAQHLGCEAIAMLAYQADSLFNRPTELHRMPHGAKYGASKHPGYEKTPNPPRLAGCVEAVFDAMVTHQRIGPVQGAGCWALAALAAAIPAEGRPDAAGRGGPATLLSVGERWAAQLSGMEERAKAALHHCAEVPLVQANATALLNLLKGDPSTSVLMTHPSKGWSFVPADAHSSAKGTTVAVSRSPKRR